MSRVREFRIAKGWSLDELCRRSGVSRNHLWAIEKSKRSPSIEVGHKIASALGVTLDELFPMSEQSAPTTEEVAV